LVKPDFQLIIKMMLKAEGYHSHSSLAARASKFINLFTAKKNEQLYGKEAADSKYID